MNLLIVILLIVCCLTKISAWLKQLSQTKGESSPIFLPSDNEYDWMLAKMWVKSADFNVHQLVTHLLKTHMISEVFEVAIHRQLSVVHPVYKVHVFPYMVMIFRFSMNLNIFVTDIFIFQPRFTVYQKPPVHDLDDI